MNASKACCGESGEDNEIVAICVSSNSGSYVRNSPRSTEIKEKCKGGESEEEEQ